MRPGNSREPSCRTRQIRGRLARQGGNSPPEFGQDQEDRRCKSHAAPLCLFLKASFSYFVLSEWTLWEWWLSP